MKRKIIYFDVQDKQRRIVAYLDSVQARLVSHKGMISLRELQSATGEELRQRRTLLPSVLRPSATVGGRFRESYEK